MSCGLFIPSSSFPFNQDNVLVTFYFRSGRKMLWLPLAPPVKRSVQDLEFLLAADRHQFTTESYGPRLEERSSQRDIVARYGEQEGIDDRATGDLAPARKQHRAEPSAKPIVEQPPSRDRGLLATDSRSPVDHLIHAQASTAPAFVPHSELTQALDYQGRTFLHVPSHVKTLPAARCRLPGRMLYALRGDTSDVATGSHPGVQCLQWCPPAGHLLFSGDLGGCVTLWNVSGTSGGGTMESRKATKIGRYDGHVQPIRSLQVSASATRMSTASVDGYVRQWDVETGTLTESLLHPSQKPCLAHLYHPFASTLTDTAGTVGGDARLIVAAVHDKVVLWDVRDSTAKPQREYSGHKGAVLHISFLDGGRKLLTSSEDKTLRTWEFRVPVPIRQFADAGMHAISHVQAHPTEPYLAAQSFDNRVVVLEDEGSGRVKFLRDRDFSGHTIAGSACQLQFSPDGQFLSSGDVNGALHIWRWKTSEKVRTFAAHAAGKQLVSHLWHPTEESRVATSSWDGLIKMWT